MCTGGAVLCFRYIERNFCHKNRNLSIGIDALPVEHEKEKDLDGREGRLKQDSTRPVSRPTTPAQCPCL